MKNFIAYRDYLGMTLISLYYILKVNELVILISIQDSAINLIQFLWHFCKKIYYSTSVNLYNTNYN